jgi:hypothetical protein
MQRLRVIPFSQGNNEKNTKIEIISKFYRTYKFSQ